MTEGARRDLEARLANKSNYLFTPVPVAIYHARDLARLDVAVWGAYFARERLNIERAAAAPQLSLAQVAFWVGSQKSKVAESTRKLVRLGYLKEVEAGRTTPTNRGKRAYRTEIPVRQRHPDFLISTALDGIDVTSEDLDSYLRERDGDEVGVSQRDTEGCPNGIPGGIPTGHGKVPQRDTLKDRDPTRPGEDEAGPRGPRGEEEDDGDFGDPPTPSIEYEEPNPDGDSSSSRGIQKTGSGKSRPRFRRLAEPPDPLLRRPSDRKELNAWRKKQQRGTSFAAKDVVGYFACRYREVVGRETEELFSTLAGMRGMVDNVREFTRRWMDGDYRRAIELVDKILERAEDRGYPISLRYFFTPARSGAAESLDRPPRRKGRPETPAERNDRAGADTPENQARIRKLQEKFAAEVEAERKNGAKQKVRRDDRRSA